MDILSTKNLKINALETSKIIEEKLIQIFQDRFFISQPKWKEVILKLFHQKNYLVSDIYLEIILPAEKHNQPLNAIGLLPAFIKFLERDQGLPKGFDPSFFPYRHQYEALQIVDQMNRQKKPALVVTAPTGAGKTEAFLLPMILDLLKTPRANRKGVRAIIMYPMNALIADQTDRLSKFISHPSNKSIKAFFYNSDTPENEKSARKDVPPNFIETREEARDNPPDIMITNYSMLEYILSRPQDLDLISDALDTIILDEAHLYNGSLAAEISLLLRRVLFKANKTSDEVLQIATSATIHSANQLDFFSKLFNKDQSQIKQIEGKRELVDIKVQNQTSHDLNEFSSDAQNLNQSNRDSLFQKYENDAFIYFIKQHMFKQKRYISSFETLLRELKESFPITDKQLLDVLNLGQFLRKSDQELPLLAHKLHMQCRFSQGIFICINSQCPDGHTDLNIGKIHLSKTFNCTTCKSPTLELFYCKGCGVTFNFAHIDGNGPMSNQYIKYARPYVNHQHYNDDHDDDEKIAEINENFQKQYILLSSLANDQVKTKKICFDSTGLLSKQGSTHFFQVIDPAFDRQSPYKCPCCKEDELASFHGYDGTTIPLVAETMLNEMPIKPEHQDVLPAFGKRLLAFSDSRKDAAKLGYELTIQHETQLIRKYIYFKLLDRLNVSVELERKITHFKNEHAGSMPPDLLTQNIDYIKKSFTSPKYIIIADLIASLASDSYSKYLWSPNIRDMSFDSFKEMMTLNHQEIQDIILYKKVADELSIPTMKFNTLEKLGLVSIKYPNLDQLKLPDSMIGSILTKDEFDRIHQDAKNDLLTGFFYLLRTSYLLSYDNKDYDRIFGYISTKVLSNKQKVLKKDKQDEMDEDKKVIYIESFTEQNKIVKWIDLCFKSLNIHKTTDEIKKFIHLIFSTLYQEALNRQDLFKWINAKQDHEIGQTLTLKFDQLAIDIPNHVYVNTSRNQIYSASFQGKIFLDIDIKTLAQINQIYLSELKFDPIPEKNDLDFFLESNGLPAFVSRNKYKNEKAGIALNRGLWSAEHSAQINAAENRRKQNLFKEGARNILSATTTLEVGIDIGDLAGVFMANFPANKSNYIQRAGRAGRRTDGSSMILTYAKSNHFNQNVFDQFEDYISRDLKKLTITLEKQKILFRHFNSLLLSLFYQSISAKSNLNYINSFQKIGFFLGFMNTPHKVSTQDAMTKFQPLLDFSTSIANQFLDFLRNLNLAQYQSRFDVLFKHTAMSDLFAQPEAKFKNYADLRDDFVRQLEIIIRDQRNEMNLMLDDWNLASGTAQQQASSKNFIRYMFNQKYDQTLILILTDAQLLPKYGFPINILKLYIQSQELGDPKDLNERLTLQREAHVAVSEYVPDSVLLADGLHIASKGLLKHYSGANLDQSYGEIGQTYICKKGHFFKKTANSSQNIQECLYPGCDQPIKHSYSYVIPKGYSTSMDDYYKIKNSTRFSKSKKVGFVKYYIDMTRASQLQSDSSPNHEIQFTNVKISLIENVPIFCQNRGDLLKGFSICKSCGYTTSDMNDLVLSQKNKLSISTHKYIYNKHLSCAPTVGSIWSNYSLAAEFKTDAILFDFVRFAYVDSSVLKALCNALQLSATELLGLDEREIAYLTIESNPSYKIVFYDAFSGGVGYVHDLVKDRLTDWLKLAEQKMYGNPKHDQECIGGCIKCIVTLKTENALDRKNGLRYLRELFPHILTNSNP